MRAKEAIELPGDFNPEFETRLLVIYSFLG